LPRSDVQAEMVIKLKQAGFRVDFTPIYWTYASGFPKAMNIGKAIDKREGVERKVVGKKKTGISRQRKDNTTEFSHPYKNGQIEVDVTEPATDKTKELDGSYAGFNPKPAVEVIIVVMKPLDEKSYTDQAIKNGKGVTWFDDCRIPYESEKDIEKYTESSTILNSDKIKSNWPLIIQGIKKSGNEINTEGRFPANLLVNDDVLNDGNITGANKEYKREYKNEHNGIFQHHGVHYGPDIINDKGFYSRYFSLDAWADKNLAELPENIQMTYPFMIVPKAAKSEKNNGLGLPTKNNHPTTKPLKLMSYLITLGSRPNDIVLDPFLGSGTTGITAKLLGRSFIGMEISPDYMKIAIERIKNYEQKK